MRRSYIASTVGFVVLLVGIVLLTRPHNTSLPSGAVTFTDSPAGANRQVNTQSSTSNQDQAFGDSDITAALRQSREPNLQTGNFTLLSSSEPAAGWYFVLLSPGDGSGDSEKVILKVTNNALSIVLGPGTVMRVADMQAAGVPQAVQDAARAQ